MRQLVASTCSTQIAQNSTASSTATTQWSRSFSWAQSWSSRTTAASTPQVVVGQGSPLTAIAPAGRQPSALRGSPEQHRYVHRAASQLIAAMIGVTTNSPSLPQEMPSPRPINPVDRPPLPARGSSGLASRSKHTGSTVLSPSTPSSHRRETAGATRAPQRARAPGGPASAAATRPGRRGLKHDRRTSHDQSGRSTSSTEATYRKLRRSPGHAFRRDPHRLVRLERIHPRPPKIGDRIVWNTTMTWYPPPWWTRRLLPGIAWTPTCWHARCRTTSIREGRGGSVSQAGVPAS